VLRSLSSTAYIPQIVETILTCLILLIAFLRPGLGADWSLRIEKRISSLVKKPFSAALAIALTVLFTRLLLLPILPIPRPAIHDEFSYLLAAQTFASGHLTNSPHPFWRHFESVHILQQPTYMSMYPPGQGLALAFGLWLTGQPWTGVLLTTALLSAVLFWSLKVWLPASFAFVGSAVAAVRWCLVSYWMNSFWGGTLPALGGALVFGSIPRLASYPNRKNALFLAAGLIILANTRPYEGLVCSLISIGLLVNWSRRLGNLRQLASPAVLLPFTILLALSAGAMLFYNSRVTGNALVLPYVQDRKEYAVAPLYIWGKLNPPPSYNSASLQQVYRAEAKLFLLTRRAWGIPELIRKLKNIWIFFLGPLLTIPFFFSFFGRSWKTSIAERRQRYSIVIVSVGVLASLQVVWLYPHYLAPVLAPFTALLVFGLQELRTQSWHGRSVGLFLSRALPVGCLLMAALPVVAGPSHQRLLYWPLQWALGSIASVHPPELEARLLADGRKALVFVEYGPEHDPGYEWVYNASNIDASPIVWARSTNPQSDAALIRFFSDRRVWLIKPDERPLVLLPVSSASPETPAASALTQ
jgi:hypothetical protein